MHDNIVDLYERHALEFDRDRGRVLHEQGWLDRFLDLVAPSGTILDVGCGMGEPIAGYFESRGRSVVGIDSSPTLIDMCRARMPEQEWIVSDMRGMSLGRRFAGVVAWDSFFHLSMEDQRNMFPCFASHSLPGAPLLFTSGPTAGESIGSYCGEPLYHFSLDPSDYRDLLAANGFYVESHVLEDPECGGHTLWLARYRSGPD